MTKTLLRPTGCLEVDDNCIEQVLLYGVQGLRMPDVNGVKQAKPAGLFDELRNGHNCVASAVSMAGFREMRLFMFCINRFGWWTRFRTPLAAYMRGSIIVCNLVVGHRSLATEGLATLRYSIHQYLIL